MEFPKLLVSECISLAILFPSFDSLMAPTKSFVIFLTVDALFICVLCCVESCFSVVQTG